MFQIDKRSKKHFNEQNNKTIKKYSDLKDKTDAFRNKKRIFDIKI